MLYFPYLHQVRGNSANCFILHILEQIFNTLIDSFIADKVGIAKDFLNSSLASGLKSNLTKLYAEQKLRTAGIGNDILTDVQKTIRTDVIYWLDRSHNDKNENDFFDLMDEFVLHLNRTCYTGITGYEFHYAMYEKGSFYKKHLDQFRNNESRQYSMIMYLNEDWTEGDGGELCIYPKDEASQNISPVNGKSVFFKSSELEHEVLVTNKTRLSITGWLKTG